jgi:anti-sigma factor ChrR (cupin superfamily)
MSGKNPHASTSRREGPDAAELAALYISGAMTGEEREAFESRLAAGDAALAAEVRLLQDAADALLQDVDPVAPSPAVRRRLMQHIDDLSPKAPQIWRAWDTSDDTPFFTLRAGDGQWEETGVEGVQVRRLFVDRPGNRMTAMFRMAAGSEYPEHEHDGPEECYVLQGDLHVGDDFVMNAGDYQRALPGSEHGRQWTKNGCLLLVTCSLSDEMM